MGLCYAMSLWELSFFIYLFSFFWIGSVLCFFVLVFFFVFETNYI